MPYVQRDGNNHIIGQYANPQPGYATEWFDPNDIELSPPDGLHVFINGQWVIDDALMKEGIKNQIARIEQEQIMPRKTREIQIQVMEYFAATQNVTKAQLYAINPAYKGMVDINNQIIALRAQL